MIDGIGMMMANTSQAVNFYASMLAQKNAARLPAEPVDTEAMAKAAALAVADEAEKVICRICFWIGFGTAWFTRPLAVRIIAKLV